MCMISGNQIEDSKIQQRIKDIIAQGGLIVFPTETVYGIGADATNKVAVKRIFMAKGRPSDNPLIVHVADKDDVILYVTHIPFYAEKLMTLFWPGPLTIVFHKNERIPYEVSGGLETVGIRMPSSIIAQKVIKAAGVPLCAPSANISGKPSSTTFEHVKDDFLGKVDLLIDGGHTEIGLESTVIDLTTPIPVLLRPGAITKQMIESALGIGIMDATENEIADIPKSPGMKYTHYAPKGHVQLIEGDMDKVVDYINQQVKRFDEKSVGVIAPSEYLELVQAYFKIDLGSIEKTDEIGRNIFMALRQMDSLYIREILIPALPAKDLGQAIMNRLIKASGHNIIHL